MKWGLVWLCCRLVNSGPGGRNLRGREKKRHSEIGSVACHAFLLIKIVVRERGGLRFLFIVPVSETRLCATERSVAECHGSVERFQQDDRPANRDANAQEGPDQEILCKAHRF